MSRKTISRLSLGDAEAQKDGVLTLHENSVQNEFLKGLFKESDRSAVIVGTSYFEELTRRKLTLLLNRGNSKSLKALLEGAGPLSTFSARIHLLHCLGAIATDAANDLNTLRKLRNHCAHNWEDFSLNDNVEVGYLAKFRNYLNLSNAESLAAYVPRTQFMLICAHYAITLNYHQNDS